MTPLSRILSYLFGIFSNMKQIVYIKVKSVIIPPQFYSPLLLHKDSLYQDFIVILLRALPYLPNKVSCAHPDFCGQDLKPQKMGITIAPVKRHPLLPTEFSPHILFRLLIMN